MFEKLSQLAIRCPILPEGTSILDLKSRFAGPRPPRALIITEPSGEPCGLVVIHNPCFIEKTFLTLDQESSTTDNLAVVSRASQSVMSRGVIMTRKGRPQGWVAPEVLCQWLAKTAQMAQLEADAKAIEVTHAREQSLMFLANISHELRTPLNAVIGYADLIRHETFGEVQPLQYGRYIDSIHQSGQHLMNSINALLNLARIDADAIALEEESICMTTLVSQTMELLQTEADRLGVGLVSNVPEDFPRVTGDPQLLRQALLNLMSNAVKFSPAGAKVRVSVARAAKDGVRITVEDRGPGIPERDLPRIILPFKQAQHGPGRTGVGTGLGLSLAKAFIELHEGRLHLLSEEGRGTRAILTLPSGRVIDQRTGIQGGFAFVRQDVLPQQQSA